jgi:hypothetical protein
LFLISNAFIRYFPVANGVVTRINLQLINDDTLIAAQRFPDFLLTGQ